MGTRSPRTASLALCTWLLLAWSCGASAHPAPEDAIHYYEHRIARDTTDMDARLARVTLLLQEGRTAAATVELGTIDKLAPTIDTAYLRGLVAMKSAAPAQAESHFSRHLEVHPGDASAHQMRGRARLALGRPETALEDLVAAVDRQPHLDPGLLIETATLADTLGETGLALALLEDATAGAAAIPQLRLHAVKILSGHRRYGEALTTLDGLIAAAGENPEWLVRRVELLVRLEQFAAAAKTARKASDLLQARKPTPWRDRKIARLEALSHNIERCRRRERCEGPPVF